MTNGHWISGIFKDELNAQQYYNGISSSREEKKSLVIKQIPIESFPFYMVRGSFGFEFFSSLEETENFLRNFKAEKEKGGTDEIFNLYYIERDISNKSMLGGDCLALSEHFMVDANTLSDICEQGLRQFLQVHSELFN